MTPQLLSGARVILNFNGQSYAAGYVLDYVIDPTVTEQNCVDMAMPAELYPTRLHVSLQLRIWRSPTNDPTQQGITLPGDRAGNTMVDPGYTEYQYLSIEAKDRVTGRTILFIPQALPGRRSGSVQAEDLLSETLNITGIGYSSLVQNASVSGINSAFGGLATAGI